MVPGGTKMQLKLPVELKFKVPVELKWGDSWHDEDPKVPSGTRI